MDYLTKSTTRKEIRNYSKIFRYVFDVKSTGEFPVLEALEKFPLIFLGSNVEILDIGELPSKIPAQCDVNSDGTFTIKIRKDVYDGAYKENIGAYRNHICHEICHVFMYSLGYTPILQRNFKNGELSCYCSSEWQVKALCGEVMIPYEETKNLTCEEIQEKYGVSRSSALYRINKITE